MVLFIMALRGLSHPETSRQGNTYGMVGMGIAILTTLFLAAPTFGGWALIILGLAMGGGVGAYVARTIPMTSMPQLVAGFHSLVGLAAVMVAGAALYAPEAFGLLSLMVACLVRQSCCQTGTLSISHSRLFLWFS